MRKQIGKALREAFAKGMQESFPWFHEEPIRPNPLGERAYRTQIRPDLALLIVLRPHLKFESFTVVVGWTTGANWPLPTRMWRGPNEPPHEDGQFFGLSALWSTSNSAHEYVLAEHVPPDAWLTDTPEQFIARLKDDRVIDEGVAKVPEAVRGAIGRLREYALPFFRRLIAAKGSHCPF